jgi:hypothetical protein
MAGVDASCNSLMYSLFLEGSDQLCNYTQRTTSLSESYAHASIHGCPFLVDSNSRLCTQCAIAVANGQPCSDVHRPELYARKSGFGIPTTNTAPFFLSMPQLRSPVMYIWSRIALASEPFTTTAGWVLPPSREKDAFMRLENYRLSRASYNVMEPAPNIHRGSMRLVRR